jgi:outer membrane protein assembly factor BamB
MKSRFVAFGVLAAALLLSTGAGCHSRITPVVVSAPDSVPVGEPATIVVRTEQSASRPVPLWVNYIIDWGDDSVETTTSYFLSTDTAQFTHTWTSVGTFHVWIENDEAVRYADGKPGTRKAVPCELDITVLGLEHAPVIDTVFCDPPVAVKDVEAFFTVVAHDPDGDSIRFRFDWGAAETTTAFFASPCSVTFSHVFTEVGTATVLIRAIDTHGANSQPETVYVSVGTAGGVIWYWRSGDPENPGESFTTSPLILNDGFDERMYAGCEGDHSFHSIRVSDGKGDKRQTTRWHEYDFTGHPAFCEATQHIIVGSDEGELYALKVDGLGVAWQWPNKPARESLTGLEWGAPAIKDNRLYVPHEDDSLYYFIDSVDHGVRVAAFTPHAGIVDAPVIDAQGNVYFGTDSGYLYKLGPELDTVFWRTRLIANGEVHSPLVGGGGAIYCASDSSRVYAVDAATGIPRWTVTLDGEPFRLALGQTALFVASSFGKVYSLNPATGSINWERQLSLTDGFNTTPIVAANGYVYFQDDADMLFCVNQPDGTVIWACDCPRYLPRSDGGNSHRPRKTQLTDYLPNPTICANGNIIVAGSDALYCVAGYPERPLDPLAPWPKWQHDVYNTGYVGGGK